MKCGYNFDTFIGRLRLNEKREITFEKIADNEGEEDNGQEEEE